MSAPRSSSQSGVARSSWIPPSAALVLLAVQILACVIADLHLAPIETAWEADPGRLCGVLHARPADVSSARQTVALIWTATVPVALAATLLATTAIDHFRAQGAAHTFAQVVTMVGVTISVAGVVLAVLGVLKILSP